MLIGVEEKIYQSIKYRKRGSIFFSADFVSKGSLASVNKALSQLAKQGKIIRLAPGIYCRPEIDEVFGLGVLYPGLDEIANAIALRDGARIIPTGTYAQNRLGLSTQIPMNAVFLTDGSPRRIKVYNGKGILFKRAAPKIFKFKNSLALMLTLALKDIGETSLTPEQIHTIQKFILPHPKEIFLQDYSIMPEWIRSLIEKTYEKEDYKIVQAQMMDDDYLTLNTKGIDPKMIANNLTPSEPIHPGEMIKDEIEYRGISQKKLAEEIGIPASVLNAVLNGKRGVTTEYALLLEAALGIEADLWLKLQADYNKQVAKSSPSFMARLNRIREVAPFL